VHKYFFFQEPSPSPTPSSAQKTSRLHRPFEEVAEGEMTASFFSILSLIHSVRKGPVPDEGVDHSQPIFREEGRGGCKRRRLQRM